MGHFVADPATLEYNGGKLHEKGTEFKEGVIAIYNTVEDMIANDYISKEAIEIGRKIESYQQDLERLGTKISEYGDILKATANIVRNNQDNIITSIH